MKYRTIIFDWDGTLGMTLHLWLAGFREALHTQGVELGDREIAADFFSNHKLSYQKYPHIDFDQLLDEVRAYVNSHLDSLVLYEGVQETLEQLSASGVTMALVSSSSRQLLKKGLELHGLDGYFESIISGDDVTRHKPHPEPFLQTLSVLDALPEEVIIIGDAKTDVIAGKAAGLATCLFLPPENELFYDFEDFMQSQPDAAITQMTDLLEVIEYISSNE